MTLINLDFLPDPALPPPLAKGLAALPSVRRADHSDDALARHLLNVAGLPAAMLVPALETSRRHGRRLGEVLAGRGQITDADLTRAYVALTGWSTADPLAEPPDPALIDRMGAVTCQCEGILPWRQLGGQTLVLVADPATFDRLQDQIEARLGPTRALLAPAGQIEAAILRSRGRALDRHARSCVAEAESCRSWGGARMWRRLASIGALVSLFLWQAPIVLLWLATGWAILTLALATGLRIAAVLASLRHQPPEPPPPAIARLPVVSVMVALYKEAGIAPRLVRRLGRLDYPRELLDILLVVEEDDRVTRRALAGADLPGWMRIVVVPDGGLKTKPRALNHALSACRGSIVGIYDAEDAPAPDQISRIVERFHARPEQVACLQGVLDFYNPHTNWLSRCFTIDYAMWFRIILPGLQRLGLAIPLGGTTVFFRRHVLERLGAWDAHNVTEDADLGMRLARHGYRTEVIATTTMEEANCRTIPWIRQRSRWLKGYMMTYAVHMRDPRLLRRQLGWWQFAGFQVFFLTTLSQFLLAPILWSFWIVPMGLPHPVVDHMPPALQLAVFGTFLVTEAVLITVGVLALRRTPNRVNPLWVPTLHLYFPLGALASYKAAWELMTRPFWWDKTHHGLFDGEATGAKPD